MATIRRTKTKRWHAEVRKLGVQKSKTFDTKIQAQVWAIELEQSLKPGALVLSKTLADALNRYRDEISPKKKSARNEHNRINKFLRNKITHLVLTDIHHTHIDEYIDEELTRIKGSSVNRDLNLLSAVFEQAKRWSWCDKNPIRGIRRPKNPQPRDRRISEDEIKRILFALDFDGETVNDQRDEIAVAFLFGLETAMRQGEIWKLCWSDVYIKQCFVKLHDTKNGSARDVPLSKEAIRLLELIKHKSKNRVFLSNQKSSATIFRRTVKMAGIEGMTFHDSRHEALTRLARRLEILDLCRMVGHRDPRSLMIYYNATATEIAGRLN